MRPYPQFPREWRAQMEPPSFSCDGCKYRNNKFCRHPEIKDKMRPFYEGLVFPHRYPWILSARRWCLGLYKELAE